MDFTGERYIPSQEGQIKYEHLHRYALSLEFVTGKTVLDIASGEGYGSALLASAAGSVTGVDLDFSSVAHATRNYKDPKLNFLVGSCDSVPLHDASFDVITSFETIEHHDKHEEMLSEMKRLLKPGGVLIISSPNRLTYSDERDYTNPFHVKELYYEEFHDLLRKHFRHIRVYGQRLGTGSFVFPLAASTASDLKPLTGNTDRVSQRVCSLPSPIYFVAVCSDSAEIERREINSVYLDSSDDLLKTLEVETTRQIKRMQDRVRQTDVESRRQIRLMQDQVARQTKDIEEARKAFERQIILQADELSKERANWSARFARQAVLEKYLSQAESRISRLEGVINWIYNSRSWRLGTRLHQLEERIRGFLPGEGTFHGEWASPTFDAVLADFVEIDGWVYSTDSPVTRVDAFLDELYLGTVRYGIPRPDVASSRKAPLDCGYHDRLSVTGLRIEGPQLLKLRVQDEKGRKQTYTRMVRLSLSSPEIMEGVLDFPTPGTVCSDAISVSGWVFSPVGRVTLVEAFLDDVFLGTVRYGVERPDVVAAFPERAPLACGFSEIISLQGMRIEGEKRLSIRVHDEQDNRQVYTRTVSISLPTAFVGKWDHPAPLALCSGSVEIGGWVFSTVAPVTLVEAFLDDIRLGSVRYGLDRHDVVAAFPATASLACGYHERFSLRAFNLQGPTLLKIRACDEKGNEQFYTRTINVESSIPRMVSRDSRVAELCRRMEAVIAEVQDKIGREPSILDWNSGLHLAEAFPQLAICSPLLLKNAKNADSALPYRDRSIDVVVIASDPSEQIQEARRIASASVIRVSDLESIDIEWQAGHVDQTLFPMTSIIIPVYNNVRYTQNCLERLVKTLPENFKGEIIVVDDASSDETPAVLEGWARANRLIKVVRNPENAGFLRSCNRGAQVAHGEILVFLNNDTLPSPGWLPPLLRILRDKCDAGAVGGKLVYPNGKLQEAGGVIFSDGSGCNFGKHEEADAPLFNFVREVDYCSGALLATRRALFMELGGFDTRFEPAYYEDTDFCFSLRQKGYRVYYQPESVIVHFEGASSGTDIQVGVKSYQAINQTKFVEKWRQALKHQPAPPAQYDLATLCALSMRNTSRNGDGH